MDRYKVVDYDRLTNCRLRGDVQSLLISAAKPGSRLLITAPRLAEVLQRDRDRTIDRVHDRFGINAVLKAEALGNCVPGFPSIGLMAYRGKSKLGRIDQEDEMTYEFSKRSIIIFIIVMIAATALTVEGTYYVLEKFVFKDANDPIVKAGGLTPVQKEVGKAQ